MDLDSITTSKLLTEFKPLIYRVLQDLNISKYHMDFEDYFQELQIQLLTIKSSFEGDIFNSDVDRFKFTAYARKGLYWYGLNLIRVSKSKLFIPTESTDLEWVFNNNNPPPLINESTIYIDEFLRLAKKRLTEEEYLLLLYLSEENHTVNDIAEILGVSRDTIYKRKRHIQLKLHNIKECLMS